MIFFPGYCVAVRNRFAALLEYAEEEQIPEKLWQEVKSSVFTAASEHIRKSRRLRRPWLSALALDIAEERRAAKVIGDSERWQRLNRNFNRQAREDKNAYLEARCEDMEREQGNSKKAFKILRELTGKRTMTAGVINDAIYAITPSRKRKTSRGDGLSTARGCMNVNRMTKRIGIFQGTMLMKNLLR
ncbi:MAG: hypothetical protein V2I33_18885 [Kangiellaceae bacterium]|jgi:hypothetical protein|nr:hypothetical protein [Kangiellaceae bacterium]